MAYGSRICDVTDPGGGLSPLVSSTSSTFASANSTALAAITANCLTSNPATAREIYFPPGIFWLASTWNIPSGAHSFKIRGGGGQPKSVDAVAGNQGCFTIIRWAGGTTGPLVQINECTGMVWEGIAFDGFIGVDLVGTTGTGLQKLINFNAQTAHGFWHEFRNCGFFRAQNLFFCEDSGDPSGTSGAGPAELKFNNCEWNTGDNAVGRVGNWDARAFRAEENQTVNTGFHQNQWGNCPVCISCGGPQGASQFAGRVTVTDGTVANCGLFLETEGSSQNSSGHIIDGLHVDMLFCSFTLYKSRRTTGIGSHVDARNIKWGSMSTALANSNEYVQISSYSGTSLNLTNSLFLKATPGLADVTVNDRVGFVDINDVNTLLGETYVTAKSSPSSYTVQQSAATLGISVNANLRAIHGEALITCVNSDQFVLSSSMITVQRMSAGRLARLANSASGGAPKLKVRDCSGFNGTLFTQTGMESLLRKTGTCWWKFEDCVGSDRQVIPSSFGNYGIGSGVPGPAGPPGPPGPAGTGGGGGGNQVTLQSKYGVLRNIQFMVTGTTGQPLAGISWSSGDVIITKDGASPLTLTNSIPIQLGSGWYNITVTAAEMQGQQIRILVRDQDATPLFMPSVINIDTYGNLLAMHEFDQDTPTVALTDGSLTSAKFAPNAINQTSVADNTLTDTKFAATNFALPAVNTSTYRLPELARLMVANVEQPQVIGTTFQARSPNGTVAGTYALNDATNPTAKSRVS